MLVDNSIIFATQQGKIYNLKAEGNELKQLANIEEAVYGPLYASEGIVYIHTQDLTIHAADAASGAKLPTISLKSGE